MPTGKVKWFNSKKGYGFITEDGTEKDIFLHVSALEESKLKPKNTEKQNKTQKIRKPNTKTVPPDIISRLNIGPLLDQNLRYSHAILVSTAVQSSVSVLYPTDRRNDPGAAHKYLIAQEN